MQRNDPKKEITYRLKSPRKARSCFLVSRLNPVKRGKEPRPMRGRKKLYRLSEGCLTKRAGARTDGN